MAIAVHGEEVKLVINGESGVTLNLREIPEFSKPAKEKIETTCLNDTEKTYIAGIGDMISELTFKTLYSAEQYQALEAIEDGSNGEDNQYVLTISGGATFSFEGKHTVTYHGGGVNTVAEMSIVVSLSKAPEFKAN
jgi:hypothetical protein